MEGRTSSPRLDGIRIVLILAAVFAIGSVGFFLAILLGHAYAPSPSALQAQQQQKPLTPTQKTAVLESVSSSTVSTSSAAWVPNNPSSSTSSGEQASQQDETQSDERLKILESVGSH